MGHFLYGYDDVVSDYKDAIVAGDNRQENQKKEKVNEIL